MSKMDERETKNFEKGAFYIALIVLVGIIGIIVNRFLTSQHFVINLFLTLGLIFGALSCYWTIKKEVSSTKELFTSITCKDERVTNIVNKGSMYFVVINSISLFLIFCFYGLGYSLDIVINEMILFIIIMGIFNFKTILSGKIASTFKGLEDPAYDSVEQLTQIKRRIFITGAIHFVIFTLFNIVFLKEAISSIIPGNYFLSYLVIFFIEFSISLIYISIDTFIAVKLNKRAIKTIK